MSPQHSPEFILQFRTSPGGLSDPPSTLIPPFPVGYVDLSSPDSTPLQGTKSPAHTHQSPTASGQMQPPESTLPSSKLFSDQYSELKFWLSPRISEEGDVVMEPCSTASCLPFPRLPLKWYENQGRLGESNRSRVTRKTSIISDDSGNLKCLNGAQVEGNLLSNKDELQAKIRECTSSKARNHYDALLAVVNMMLEKGPILPTREVGAVYSGKKHGVSSNASTSANIYDILSRHLNIVQIYINGKAYIMENTGSVSTLLQTLEGTIDTDKVVNQRTQERIGGVLKQVLEYAEPPRDKQIIKGLIATVTSIKQAAKLQGIQSRKGSRTAKNQLELGLTMFNDKNNITSC